MPNMYYQGPYSVNPSYYGYHMRLGPVADPGPEPWPRPWPWPWQWPGGSYPMPVPPGPVGDPLPPMGQMRDLAQDVSVSLTREKQAEIRVRELEIEIEAVKHRLDTLKLVRDTLKREHKIE